MKCLTILGATGSIGVHTLDVIRQYPDRFSVIALTAHHNIELLFKQCLQTMPSYAVVSTEPLAKNLQQRLREQSLKTKVLFGSKALTEVASLSEVDTVIAAIIGAAGLLPTLAAINAKKRVLLANREALVMAGNLLMEEAKRSQALLLPIDRGHNAIFQCLYRNTSIGCAHQEISKLILTASGGALHNKPLEQLEEATPEQVCQHPNWTMEKKTRVDSATLMNKGFEVIEAYFLFGLTLEQIYVILHPQRIVYSLLEYRDGSCSAQLISPDSLHPISYALAWPERLANSASRFDLLEMARLDFQAIDEARYPCLNLAYQAIKIGGSATTILNAANEVVVQAFLEAKINFTDIARINKQVLEKIHSRPMTSIEVILEDDSLAREVALEMIGLKSYGSSLDADMMQLAIS